ncbi:MAG: NADH-quinone oxidoreductase subunit L, partial [Anaerolineae bacterium]
ANLCFSFDSRWVIDPLVNWVGRTAFQLSGLNRLFDRRVVDGTVNLVADSTKGSGRVLRFLQTGRVQNYALVIFISLLFLAGFYLTR